MGQCLKTFPGPWYRDPSTHLDEEQFRLPCQGWTLFSLEVFPQFRCPDFKIVSPHDFLAFPICSPVSHKNHYQAVAVPVVSSALCITNITLIYSTRSADIKGLLKISYCFKVLLVYTVFIYKICLKRPSSSNTCFKKSFGRLNTFHNFSKQHVSLQIPVSANFKFQFPESLRADVNVMPSIVPPLR